MMNDYIESRLVAQRIDSLVRQASQDRIAVRLSRESPRFGFDIKVEIRIRAGRPQPLTDS